MNSPEPQSCASCGRPQWSGDRFCPACGAESLDGPSAAYHDLGEPESLTSTGGSDRSQRRDAVIGLGVLVSLVAALAGLFVLGVRSDDDTAADAADGTAAEAALPGSDLDSSEPDSSRPPATSTPSPSPQPTAPGYPELGATVRSLEMGTGWMVTTDRQDVLAINLESGEVLTVESGRRIGQPSFVFSEGVVRSESVVDNTWRLLPWTDVAQGDEEVERLGETDADPDELIELPAGQVIRVILDEVVGPVALTADFGNPFLQATAITLNETKTIEVSDVVGLLWRQFFGPPPELEAAHGALWTDDGTVAYRWTWTDDWVQVSAGQLLFDGSHGVALVRCDSPADCPGVVVNPAGDERATFASGAFQTIFDTPSLSPDLTRVATIDASAGQANPLVVAEPALNVTNLTTGQEQRFEMTKFDWWSFGVWSPNSRYLLPDADGRMTGSTNAQLVALDTETGEFHRLDLFNDGLGSGAVFLAEIDRPR